MKLSDYEHLIGQQATIHPDSRFFSQMAKGGDNQPLTVKRPHLVGKKLWFSCYFPNGYQNDYMLNDLVFLNPLQTNSDMRFLLKASLTEVDTGGE